MHSYPQAFEKCLQDALSGPGILFICLDQPHRLTKSLMRSAMNQMQFSARDYHHVLKLARTIADLAGESRIGPQHLAAIAIPAEIDPILNSKEVVTFSQKFL